MKNKNRSKKNLIGMIIVIVFSISSLLIGRQSTTLEKMLQNSIQVVEYYVIKRPVEIVTDILHEYNQMQDVYEENKILKQRIDEYNQLAAENELLESEIKELQKILEINELPIDAKIKNTTVIGRSIDGWNNEISIKSGSLSGIEVSMPLITSEGLVGIVNEVTELSSTVQLLTTPNPSNKLPVRIENGETVIYGILDGFDIERKQYRVTLLTATKEIAKESKVYTSGLGSDDKIPAGLYLGKSDELFIQSDGNEVFVYVKPSVDFDDIRYASVIVTGAKNEE